MNHPKSTRRGVATLWVMAIIAVGMSISYAVMRSQATAVQVQSNSRRMHRAQTVARTGVSVALRRMHESTWGGVGSTLSGSVGPNEAYSVTYYTGDITLKATDADYATQLADTPWRVTLVATGTVKDPSANTSVSQEIRVVVRLNPRATAADANGWAAAQAYRFYQTAGSDITLHSPMRIDGPMRLQGTLQFSPDYGWNNSTRSRYYSDLDRKRTEQGFDWRPMTGPIDAPTSTFGSPATTLVTSLAVARNTVAAAAVPDWSVATSQFKYKLYPGGKEYAAATLPSTVSNTTLAGDTDTNPLGIYVASGSATLDTNTTVNGTIVTTGTTTLAVRGTNVQMSPKDLPGLGGSAVPTRLPTIVAADDIDFEGGAKGVITGIVSARDRIRFREGSQAQSIIVNGRMMAGELRAEGRTEFLGLVWSTVSTLFTTVQLVLDPNTNLVDWLQATQGLDSQPRIIVQADSTAPTAVYHWSPTATEIFSPHAEDAGMRWDLVRWREGSE